VALTAASRKRLPHLRGAPQLVVYTGSDPAANTEWSELVPAGKVWQLLSLTAVLVTDANAANRYVAFGIGADGTSGSMLWTGLDTPQTASKTVYWSAAPAASPVSSPVNDLLMICPLPGEVILPAGAILESYTTNRQAGDNWGIPKFTVIEYDVPA
jgi:hypothetical protein